MGARSSRESAMDGYTPIPWGIKLHNPIAYPSEASSSVKPHARLSNGTTVRNDCNDVGFGLSAFESCCRYSNRWTCGRQSGFQLCRSHSNGEPWAQDVINVSSAPFMNQ